MTASGSIAATGDRLQSPTVETRVPCHPRPARAKGRAQIEAYLPGTARSRGRPRHAWAALRASPAWRLTGKQMHRQETRCSCRRRTTDTSKDIRRRPCVPPAGCRFAQIQDVNRNPAATVAARTLSHAPRVRRATPRRRGGVVARLSAQNNSLQSRIMFATTITYACADPRLPPRQAGCRRIRSPRRVKGRAGGT
jgi:hypothetical protein